MPTPRYINEKPIHVNWWKTEDLEQTDLSEFPLFDDLSIDPVWEWIPGRDRRAPPQMVGAILRSEQVGPLAGFSWWESLFPVNNPSRPIGAVIPKGTVARPHNEFQPGWELVIFEKDGFVYVLQNLNVNADNKLLFETWFRVSTPVYEQAWNEVVTAMRARDKAQPSKSVA